MLCEMHIQRCYTITTLCVLYRFFLHSVPISFLPSVVGLSDCIMINSVPWQRKMNQEVCQINWDIGPEYQELTCLLVSQPQSESWADVSLPPRQSRVSHLDKLPSALSWETNRCHTFSTALFQFSYRQLHNTYTHTHTWEHTALFLKERMFP